MPHVSVKFWPGPSEEQKQELAERITEEVMRVLASGRDSISVSLEEVDSGAWKAEVYDPEIVGREERLYKKPGYTM